MCLIRYRGAERLTSSADFDDHDHDDYLDYVDDPCDDGGAYLAHA